MRREDVFLDLIDCLDYYQRPEILIGNKGVMCPACGIPTESTLIKTIYSTKNVLIFIFDRKEIENTFNHDMIDYPDVINLSDYIEYKKKKEKFFLAGVVNMLGDNFSWSNYVGFCRMEKNGDWYSYEDENVNLTNLQQIKNTGLPVILIYHKILKK